MTSSGAAGDWTYIEWAFGGAKANVGFDDATESLDAPPSSPVPASAPLPVPAPPPPQPVNPTRTPFQTDPT